VLNSQRMSLECQSRLPEKTHKSQSIDRNRFVPTMIAAAILAMFAGTSHANTTSEPTTAATSESTQTTSTEPTNASVAPSGSGIANNTVQNKLAPPSIAAVSPPSPVSSAAPSMSPDAKSLTTSAPTPTGDSTGNAPIAPPASPITLDVKEPKTGDAALEVKTVPPVDAAPISVSTNVVSAPVGVSTVVSSTPPSDLWDRIRSGFAMNDLDDELVGKWEKYYADRPDYVARIVDRSSKYMFYIVTELERRNMPLEIALLPMIESAFNPIAHSSAKASGIWQFIPSTGTQFGMKQDWWTDSRRDIVAATNGALDYLTKLNGMFGDWQLALASYNWGEGSVGRAVARSKAAGRDGTYLTLSMPAETRNYLPKLQAVKNIIRNPSAFGLSIASVPNEPYFKTITLAHALDLKKAAQLAGMSEAEFVALNPAHNRPVILGRGEFQILLPADKADEFLSRLEADERPRVSWRAYKTKPGDRIESIAQRFGSTAAAIKSVNGIRAVSPVLPAGYNLLVPSDGPSEDALGSIQNAVFTKFPEYVAPRAHRVAKGETLAAIAKRYGVAPATLAKWNRLGKSSVRAGQTLYVSGPAPTRAQAKNVRASYKAGGGSKQKSSKSTRGTGGKAGKRAVKAKRRK
jgi:membrane-bound lytic murein transglycosylase D